VPDATCKTCPFFDYSTNEDGGSRDFQCRREPKRYISAEQSLAGGPVAWWPPVSPDDWCGEHPLRQRDRLAAMAMQGILASAPHWCDADALKAGYPPKEIVAVNAYEIADAMLAERERRTTTPNTTETP
jgi:hypothetical protein